MIALSAIGQVLSDEINKLENKYSNLMPGKWQIMPDHVHLILHLQAQPIDNVPRHVPTCPAGDSGPQPGFRLFHSQSFERRDHEMDED